MLCELAIENFALIDDLRLDFGRGFTVLTGETGAGKSIIIDALNAVLGQRLGADAVRGGEESATVEAVFDASDVPRALEAVAESGLRNGDDPTIILTRQISGGRSQYRVNHRASTLGLLHSIGRHLVDIHGQHDHQTLIHEENHLSFLDVFGGPKHLEMCAQYQAQYDSFWRAAKAIRDLQLDERERAQRLDMLRFQVDEIDDAGLAPDEEDVLGAERSRLQHAERIRDSITTAADLLDRDAEEKMPALVAVQAAAKELRAAAEVDPELSAIADELETAAVIVQEAVRSLDVHVGDLEANPGRLEEIERRLADIAALKRKYGDSVAEVLAFGERAEAELAELADVETREQELGAELESCREAAGAIADKLSKARAKLGKRLAEVVVAELRGLGMEAAAFGAELDRKEGDDGLPGADGRRWEATSRGIDACRFVFSANAGEDPRRLSKIASGGELSRLMLVFKSVCSRGAQIPTIVFDEIDAGIGGQVAHAVAEKLAGVAIAGQALCVTHLAQIARLADRHIHVSKEVEGGRTIVRVRELCGEERVGEMARMLGATQKDAVARRHAEELLRGAATDKESIRAKVGASE